MFLEGDLIDLLVLFSTDNHCLFPMSVVGS